MNKQIIDKLKKLKPILKDKYGIEEFAVFGSVARGEDREDSDVDLVVFDMKKSYFDLLEAKYFLEDEIQKDVDLGLFDGMKTFVKNRIKKDFVYV